MCRYDGDDYDWYVDEETEEVAVRRHLCEDCDRFIEIGETMTVFTARETDNEYVSAYQRPELASHPTGPGHATSWVNWRERFVIIDDVDLEVFEALGFVTGEVENPEVGQALHYCCSQCRSAAGWLTAICDQHTVMVTRVDLAQHWDEYDAATLGEDFRRLNTLCRNKWRMFPGRSEIAWPDYVRKLTTRAIAHAVSAGLDGSH